MNFNDTDWEEIQREINLGTDAPKIEQLEKISILDILEGFPKNETWMICLGRFRVKWTDKENFESWWAKKILWWIGRVDGD